MDLILVAVISLGSDWLDCRGNLVCRFQEVCCV